MVDGGSDSPRFDLYWPMCFPLNQGATLPSPESIPETVAHASPSPFVTAFFSFALAKNCFIKFFPACNSALASPNNITFGFCFVRTAYTSLAWKASSTSFASVRVMCEAPVSTMDVNIVWTLWARRSTALLKAASLVFGSSFLLSMAVSDENIDIDGSGGGSPSSRPIFKIDMLALRVA